MVECVKLKAAQGTDLSDLFYLAHQLVDRNPGSGHG